MNREEREKAEDALEKAIASWEKGEIQRLEDGRVSAPQEVEDVLRAAGRPLILLVWEKKNAGDERVIKFITTLKELFAHNRGVEFRPALQEGV